MTYTLSLSLRRTNHTSNHEAAEDAQTEAIWLNGYDGNIRTLHLSGPITSVSMAWPTRADLHDLADAMERAERWASEVGA